MRINQIPVVQYIIYSTTSLKVYELKNTLQKIFSLLLIVIVFIGKNSYFVHLEKTNKFIQT